jgi:hypothetical protein
MTSVVQVWSDFDKWLRNGLPINYQEALFDVAWEGGSKDPLGNVQRCIGRADGCHGCTKPEIK